MRHRLVIPLASIAPQNPHAEVVVVNGVEILPLLLHHPRLVLRQLHRTPNYIAHQPMT